jgi:hypothetical protein
MTDNFAKNYLESALAEFRYLKKQGDRAMAQLDDQQFFVALDAESNSVAVIVKTSEISRITKTNPLTYEIAQPKLLHALC